jgi:nicotinate-nucleotide adenylyltransferase
VVNRNNNYKEMYQEVEKKREKYSVQIQVVDIPNIEISSTDIRNRILLKKSIKYIVPEDISDYIYNYGLYGSI